MATNFPESLDALNNPQSTDSMSGHAALHANVNDAIEAMQAKIGIDGSANADSLDYKVSTLENQVNAIGDSTDTTITLLGLEGNNDLVVTGIENKTTIDSFAKSAWRSVKYLLQISRGSVYHTSTITIVQDGDDVHLLESDVVENIEDSNLATVTFEEVSGIINLCITPVSSPVTARFYRTALKV